MASRDVARGLRRSALIVALGLCFAGGAHAQSPVGSIFGGTTSNTPVTILNVETGVTREITSDAAGRFSFTQLQPGRYKVTSAGATKDVQVNIGTGTAVDFSDPTRAATTLGTVTVVGTSAINPIDVSSVESTTVFTAQQIDQLPVVRDVTSVALLAPGTVRGDTGLGNLASFGGSSVAENAYFVNGFDVTNIRNFISFADVPFDAIAEEQVKTGGYGAEFGRSLGGVINVVTKRGTNEWKGGISVYWTPESLQEESKDVLSRDPALIGSDAPYFVYRSANEAASLTYNIYGGGPLIKDRLFVFGLIQGRDDTTENFFELSSQKTSNTRPNGMVKLDWSLSNHHLLEFTGIYNKTETEFTTYENEAGEPYTGRHGAPNSIFSVTDGGEVFIAKYTGYLTEDFTVSALAGHLEIDNLQSLLPGAECPPILDSRAAGLPLVPLGCFNTNQFLIPDPALGGRPDQDKRRAFRIDAEWRLGDHDLRFGHDHERFESSSTGTTFSGGGEAYRYFNAGTLFGPDEASLGDLVRIRTTFIESGTFEVINTATYVEDSWHATDNLLLYGGLRAETFENKNAHGVTFVDSGTQVAPRLGFSWDVDGDSTFKVFGNAGRYYIPVSSNINISATSASEFTEAWYFLDGIDPATGLPIYDPANVLFPLETNGSGLRPIRAPSRPPTSIRCTRTNSSWASSTRWATTGRWACAASGARSRPAWMTPARSMATTGGRPITASIPTLPGTGTASTWPIAGSSTRARTPHWRWTRTTTARSRCTRCRRATSACPNTAASTRRWNSSSNAPIGTAGTCRAPTPLPKVAATSRAMSIPRSSKAPRDRPRTSTLPRSNRVPTVIYPTTVATH